MNRFFDENKVDQALLAADIASTTSTSKYYNLQDHRIVAFPFKVNGMALTNTVVAQLVQATDAAGTGSKNVTGATCTITANSNVQGATVTLATFTAGSVIVINGLTFTGHASTTTVANREFDISGTDTADAAELVTCINDETYGVPGVTATSALGVVTLTPTDPGGESISVTGVATIGVAATTEAIGYLEIEANQLDTANLFNHVAVSLTTNATLHCQADCIRDRSRYTPEQQFAAYKLGV